MNFHAVALLLILFHFAYTEKVYSKMERKILDEIETYRQKMKVGIPDLGIPKIEPLEVPDVDLSPIKIGTIGVFNVAKLSKAVVSGLTEFTVDHLYLNYIGFEVQINLTFPVINNHGYYEVDGTLMKLLPVYGKGPFTNKLHHLHVSAHAVFDTDDNGILVVESLKMHTDIQDLEVNLQGLLGGGAFGDQINKVIQSVALKVVKSLTPKLLDQYRDYIIKYTNAVLAKLDIGGNMIG